MKQNKAPRGKYDPRRKSERGGKPGYGDKIGVQAKKATPRVGELPLPKGEIKPRVNLKPGALTAPLPPVIVSVGDGEISNIITIGWTGILATHPPKTYISVRPERYSYGIIKRTGEFVINLTTVEMARAVDYAGIYTGAKVDKLEKTGLTLTESSAVSAPTIAQSPLTLECRVCEVKSMGTHDVFVADIVGASASPDMLDGEGRLRYDKADLLAYAHGEYYALGQKLGAFGFSTYKGHKGGRSPRSVSKKRDGSSGDKEKSIKEEAK